jgi:hypothetical protein
MPQNFSDDGHGWRKFAIGCEVIQCRNKFAMGEIASGSENYNRAWLRHSARRQPFAQRIWFRLISGSIHE